MSKSVKWFMLFYVGFLVFCTMFILNMDWNKRMFHNMWVGALTIASILFSILALKRAEEARTAETKMERQEQNARDVMTNLAWIKDSQETARRSKEHN